MADSPFVDATPDAAANTDIANSEADFQSYVNLENEMEATPNYTGPLAVEATHELDAQRVALDDYAVQEQQRQIDLVTEVYGASNTSSLQEAQQNLTALKNQETQDEKAP